MIIFGIILYWNQKLKKEVIERKKAEKNERLAKEHAEHTAHELSKTLDELKTTQDQLVQSEKLAALGQLIASIAHEINTPLGAIQSILTSINEATDDFLRELPQIIKILPEKELKLFLKLTTSRLPGIEKVPSTARRRINRGIISALEKAGCECNKYIADTLILFDFSYHPEEFIPLIINREKDFIFSVARNLYNLRTGLETISISSQKAAKVVFALKNFSHFSHSEEKVDADLQSSLETVLTLYDNQIKQNILLNVEFSPIEPVPCYVDELNQVWTNLIHNALHAMDNSGTLDISLKQIDGFAQVMIKDNGKGIPIEIHDKIFKPFFTTKKTGEGSGLGLDIVKKIVEKHDGTITFESETGKGTAFYVSIPLTPTQTKQ